MARKAQQDEEQKLVAVRMELKAVKALERIGDELDRSVSWLLRKAADEFIERHQAQKSK